MAGQSAGGMSVCDHLVAPGSKGLFRAAIIQSAPCQAQADLPKAEQSSLDYAARAGCGDPRTAADCLRALPVDKLREPVTFYNIGEDALPGPVTGTAALPVDPVAAIARDDAARVPVLIGTNRDEFTFSSHCSISGWESTTPLSNTRIYCEIPSAPMRLPWASDTHWKTTAATCPWRTRRRSPTGVFACVNERMSDDLARVGPVYAYEFNDRDAPAPEPMRTLPFPIGASHSLELRFLFDLGGAPPLNPAQQSLSDQMIDYWSQFITTGVPQAEGQPDWPPLGADVAAQPWMSLQADGSRVVTTFGESHQCPFWANLPA